MPVIGVESAFRDNARLARERRERRQDTVGRVRTQRGRRRDRWPEALLREVACTRCGQPGRVGEMRLTGDGHCCEACAQQEEVEVRRRQGVRDAGGGLGLLLLTAVPASGVVWWLSGQSLSLRVGDTWLALMGSALLVLANLVVAGATARQALRQAGDEELSGRERLRLRAFVWLAIALGALPLAFLVV